MVTDLFHSVSLNIHNPHFLIMQGRITKVLNMKPNEVCVQFIYELVMNTNNVLFCVKIIDPING